MIIIINAELVGVAEAEKKKKGSASRDGGEVH
jgi:hypothetical protein